MSYSRTIINGTSVSQEGGPSFDQELEDLQDQIDIRAAEFGGVTTGSGGNYVASPSLPWTSYQDGMSIRLRLNHANTGGATINVSGLGLKTVYKAGGTVPMAGGEFSSGCVYDFRYSNADDVGYFVLMSGFTLGLGDFPAEWRLEANASSGQTSTSNSYITVLYDTPGTNTGPAWSYSAGTWTCLIGGVYNIRAVIFAASSITGLLGIRKNGALVLVGSTGQAINNLICTGVLRFAPGDTLQIRAFSNSGTYNIDVTTDGYRELIVQRVGE